MEILDRCHGVRRVVLKLCWDESREELKGICRTGKVDGMCSALPLDMEVDAGVTLPARIRVRGTGPEAKSPNRAMPWSRVARRRVSPQLRLGTRAPWLHEGVLRRSGPRHMGAIIGGGE